MITYKNYLALAISLLCVFNISAKSIESDSTGLPGDGFDLAAVLDLFKQSESLEAFEESLNKEDNAYNNLDLNGDNEVDYIRVEDHVDGDVHAIILRVPISEKESQDVAVIELEQTGSEEVTVQIVGDEDIYGEDYIVEPADDKSDKSPNAIAPMVVVNVWIWPSVRFVYAPGYRAWVSPWRWSYYPRWWKPWRPVRWGVYRAHHARHHHHYHVVHVHRCSRAHKVYHTHRVASASVKRRHDAVHHKHKATNHAHKNADKKSGAKYKAKTNGKKTSKDSKKNGNKHKAKVNNKKTSKSGRSQRAPAKSGSHSKGGKR